MRDNSARTWRVHLRRHEVCSVPLAPLFHCPIWAWHVRCSIGAQIGLVIINHVREFCYSFDYDIKIWGGPRFLFNSGKGEGGCDGYTLIETNLFYGCPRQVQLNWKLLLATSYFLVTPQKERNSCIWLYTMTTCIRYHTYRRKYVLNWTKQTFLSAEFFWRRLWGIHPT